jgi:crossover junction endodeoxyribonuclease RuvC
MITRILGIDPGSRITGYGIIDMIGNQATYVTSGCIRMADEPIPERLRRIFIDLTAVIEEFQPSESAVEIIFMHRNADAAIKLGHARGAAIVALAQQALPIFEFTANQIKQAIVGRGHADKVQVQHMIKILLKLAESPPPDAADALAVALCHGHTRATLNKIPAIQGRRYGRFQ